MKWLDTLAKYVGSHTALLAKALLAVALLLVVALEAHRPALEFCESLWNSLHLPPWESPEWQSPPDLAAPGSE